MKIIPRFEPGLFQLLQLLHAEKTESNMQRYHQDLIGVSPLAMHISVKPGQDYWLYVRNLTDIIRELYTLTFKESCFKTFPWVLFQ